MHEIIDDRELITLRNYGVKVCGTYHKAHIFDSDTSHERVGILFLNGLYASRASNGDAAVYWAGCLAEHGYPSFRIDLPGYGDSEGNPPADWLGYINTGGYAAVTVAAMKELKTRFHLSGLIMVGHCAGSVSAIYAAASDECKGLVLMDPYFHLPKEVQPKVRQHLINWAFKSPVGAFFSKVFDLIKHTRLFLRRNSPPSNTNFSLLRAWKSVASSGIPILYLKAPSRGSSGAKPRTGEFDYLKHAMALAGRKSRITVKIAEGANHSFSNHAGRIAVRQYTEFWLNANFPLVEPAISHPISAHSETATAKSRIAVSAHNPLSES